MHCRVVAEVAIRLNGGGDAVGGDLAPNKQGLRSMGELEMEPAELSVLEEVTDELLQSHGLLEPPVSAVLVEDAAQV